MKLICVAMSALRIESVDPKQQAQLERIHQVQHWAPQRCGRDQLTPRIMHHTWAAGVQKAASAPANPKIAPHTDSRISIVA